MQTLVYRLEFKKAVCRTQQKIGNAHLFEPVVSRTSAQHRMIDDLVALVALFGGRSFSHSIDSGKSNKEVATAPDCSVNTVAKHRMHLMQKLGLPSAAEIVLYAVRKRIIT